ncbi:MAG: tetratricopeptide repeat protein [Acidobacteriota bacterium]
MKKLVVVALIGLYLGGSQKVLGLPSSQIHSSPNPVSKNEWSALRSRLIEEGLDPDEIGLPGEVTDEMVQWARARVTADTPRGVADDLLAAIVGFAGLDLQYSPGYTGTAVEVFESRTANCLAFTHLYVGLSRALGVPTFYVTWNRVERFSRQGDLVIASGHISAAHRTATDLVVLEFGAVEGLETRHVSPISDLNAMARHYANRSAELLGDEKIDASVRAGEIATRVDPSLPDGWVNLGVARRRAGDPTGAEKAYRRAIEVDGDNSSAYANLSVLFRLQGDRDAANQIIAMLDERGSRNPYLYLELGKQSLAAGELEDAGRYFKRAHRFGSDIAETRAARGLWYFENGDPRKAKKWLLRAQAIDPSDPTTLRLESMLSSSQPDSALRPRQ